jgi:hypothetical protein
VIVKAPDERFPTAPEGTFLALCVDEIDLGRVKTSFGGEDRERNMVRLVWQLDEADRDGKPYLIKKDYTASLHEKATLRKHLQSWRGRAFTQTELVGFDLETVVGAGCMISVVHATGSKGGTFGNVEAVMKLPKGSSPPAKGGYVRVKDRTAPEDVPTIQRQKPPEEQPPDFGEAYRGITDDDVPF